MIRLIKVEWRESRDIVIVPYLYHPDQAELSDRSLVIVLVSLFFLKYIYRRVMS